MILNLIERAIAAEAPNVNVPSANEIGTSININTTGGDIDSLVTLVISWIIYIAGVLAFIYLVVSGITFITAGGNAEQAKKGQQGLIYAVIGIIVIALAYVILQAASGVGAD